MPLKINIYQPLMNTSMVHHPPHLFVYGGTCAISFCMRLYYYYYYTTYKYIIIIKWSLCGRVGWGQSCGRGRADIKLSDRLTLMIFRCRVPYKTEPINKTRTNTSNGGIHLKVTEQNEKLFRILPPIRSGVRVSSSPADD